MSDIINAIVEMRGDLCILIYHGLGGEGFAELGEDRTIAYSDMVNNLALKGCRFVFVVDACHAASAVEAFKDMSADADSLLIASSGSQEESYGSVLPTASERSVSWLLKSLQQYGSVPESITKNDVTQHPEVWFFNASTKAVERSTEFSAFPFLPGVPSV